ncbi:septation protein SepH [Nocardia sp. BMG111209]|uniref:septation protein SepH n=1 Tax=Nocardia sp. BMG111209 TaxID=1160137 RepID=UPI00039AE906|nr:septation protein SepH [Nocardia sp. BMG111209]
MRELRVIGLTPDSTHIVCIDTETGQKYRLAADEKLRAAARGDLARFGQIEIETEATMRPRDIQARIRAGASVEQVTEESGMPASRVERFAYPVLLERARAAELAQRAHPVRKDGPAVETLIEVVSSAFSERGHNIDIAEWDAWKDEKGYWVAQLQWQAGRSVIAAHWRYQPDAHGGSVSPLDDPASDLVDPDFGRALRGLATILPEPAAASGAAEAAAAPAPAPRGEGATAARAAAERSQQGFDEYYEQRAAVGGNAVAVTGGVPPKAPAAPQHAPAPAATAPAPQHAAPAAPQPGGTAAPQPGDPAAPQPVSPQPAAPAATAPAPPATPPAAEPAPAPAKSAPAAAKSTPAAAKSTPAKAAPKARAKRGGKAPMPSWEDVLLGVRSSGH